MPLRVRSSAVTATLLALAVIVLMLLPAHAAAERQCGDLPGIGIRAGYDIEARSLSCKQAKKVVRTWTNEVAEGGRGKAVFVLGQRFKCRSRSTGYESARTRCGASLGNVAFSWGA